KQMLAMNPKANEGPPGHGLALRDFIFMMRKDVVDAAAMDVERVAEILHRHGGTFDMPTGTSLAERRGPSRLFQLLGGLPQGEVARLLFLVLVGVDASGDLQFSSIEPGQASIVRKSRYSEINGVILAISVLRLQQPIDQVDHLGNVFCRRRDEV